MLRNFKNEKTFLSAKFQFSAIENFNIISNKPFFLLKALNPGLKLLEHKILTYFISVPEAGNVIAGVELTVDVLKTSLNAIGDIMRKVAIGIENESQHPWKALNVYFSSGTSDIPLPYSVDSGNNKFNNPVKSMVIW